MGKRQNIDDGKEVAAEIRALREVMDRRSRDESARAGFRLIKERTRRDASVASSRTRPISRAVAAEDAVLEALRREGLDPLQLPRAPRGKSWPAKDAARSASKLTRAVFDKAWQRLRDDKRIAER